MKNSNKNQKTTKLFLLAFISMIFIVSMIYFVSAEFTLTITSTPANPTGQAPFKVDFVVSPSGGTFPLTCSANFGHGGDRADGVIIPAGASPWSGFHTYTDAGTFSLDVICTDSEGKTANANKIVTVTATGGLNGGNSCTDALGSDFSCVNVNNGGWMYFPSETQTVGDYTLGTYTKNGEKYGCVKSGPNIAEVLKDCTTDESCCRTATSTGSSCSEGTCDITCQVRKAATAIVFDIYYDKSLEGEPTTCEIKDKNNNQVLEDKNNLANRYTEEQANNLFTVELSYTGTYKDKLKTMIDSKEKYSASCKLDNKEFIPCSGEIDMAATGLPTCNQYSDESYGWVEEGKENDECYKPEGGSITIAKPEELDNYDVESNAGKVCCKKTKEAGANAGQTSPVASGGDLFGICFGQAGDIWSKGYALIGTTDKAAFDKLKIDLDHQETKNGKTTYYYKVGVTWWECLFNYASIAYGFATSIRLTTQGGDRQIGTCANEKPLPGSTYCSSCNEDPYRICTKQRCQILGKCIALAPEGNATAEADKDYRCEEGTCEEKGDIQLLKINASWYGDTEELGNKQSTTGSKAGTVKLDLNEIDWNTKSISVAITTKELAQCRYILDKANSNFSEMTDFDDNYFPQNNQQTVIVPLEGDVSRNANHTIYIKCNNICNLPHEASYDYNQVKFKLKAKPDQLPPEIIFIDPAKNSILSSDLGYINASFWLDEVGKCKFSDISINFTSNYNDTREQMMIPFGQISPNPVNSSVEAGGCYQAKCLDRNEQCSRCWLKLNPKKGFETLNSTNSEFNETKLYHYVIRCDDGKNVMTQDDMLDYIIMTAPGYDINITKPEQGQKDYDDSPAIEVTTGIRNTQCKYKIYNTSNIPRTPPEWENMTFIDEAVSTIHDGESNESLEGSTLGKPYTIYALCRDTWNMEARDNVTFFVLKDLNAPRLIRTYHDTITGDFLTIETDEESTCAFSYTGCNFNFTQGNAMTGELQYLHSAYWRDKTFFVKCVDKWDNYPTASGSTSNPAYDYCTAVLKPFEIPIIA